MGCRHKQLVIQIYIRLGIQAQTLSNIQVLERERSTLDTILAPFALSMAYPLYIYCSHITSLLFKDFIFLLQFGNIRIRNTLEKSCNRKRPARNGYWWKGSTVQQRNNRATVCWRTIKTNKLKIIFSVVGVTLVYG